VRRFLALAAVLAVAPPAHAKVETFRIAQGSHPSITSDGGTLAFLSLNDYNPASEDTSEGGDEGGSHWLFDVASRTFTRASVPVFDRFGALVTWVGGGGPITPDGTRLIAAGDDRLIGGEASASGWYRWFPGAGGSLITRVTSASPEELAVSRDGSAFAIARNDEPGSYNKTLLYFGGGGPKVVATRAWEPSLSYDGRFIAYTRQTGINSSAVFVKDMRTGKTRVASSDSRGDEGQGWGGMISGDGRYVAFRSNSRLVPRAGGWLQVYVKDLETGRTSLGLTTSKGRVPRGQELIVRDAIGASEPQSVKISADGRFLVFASRAPLAGGRPKEALWLKDRRTGRVTRIADAEQLLPGSWYHLSGDGSGLVFAVYEPPPTVILYYAQLRSGGGTCEQPTQHPDRGLRGVDLALVKDELRPTAAELRRARAVLTDPADRTFLAELERIARRYGRASQSSDIEKLVDDAKCTLLDDARSKLEDYLKDKGLEQHVDLVSRLSALKEVLRGTATDADKEKLLKANVEALIGRIAGREKAAKHAGTVADVQKLLEAYMGGTLGKETEKRVKKELLKHVKKASQKFFGDDAPELVDQLLTLRDVLSGSPSAKQQSEVLKDSIAGLAQQLLFKDILKTPQVRAAMFGFELGRAFGERIAADLKVIGQVGLARDCAIALGPSQSAPGAIDYSKPASGTVPSGQGLWHARWRCDVLPEAFAEGSQGGLVQATRPSDATLREKAIWGVTTDGPVVTYDPAYSR